MAILMVVGLSSTQIVPVIRSFIINKSCLTNSRTAVGLVYREVEEM